MMMAPASLLRLLAEQPSARQAEDRRRTPATTPRFPLLRKLLCTHHCEEVRAGHV
jgi:hypothetical protein